MRELTVQTSNNTAAIENLRFIVIVNCGPCEAYIEKCLSSIIAQSYSNWRAVVSIDPCGDRTYENAAAFSRRDPRISIKQNARQCFAMENLARGVERSQAMPEDVFVVLDGDDWFHSDQALQKISATYTNTNCWMTYGSWISDVRDMSGLWPPYPDGTTNFRQIRWLGTAIRSWKKWLWDLIEERDFLDDDGKFFKVGEDLAVMLPMLEMSGTRNARHIAEPLMWYNCVNPAGAAKIWPEATRKTARLIRNRPPYQPLQAAPDHPKS